MKFAAALALACLAACSSPDPALYTIASVPGAARPGGPSAIELRDVSVARYLERKPIVRSSEDYRLDVSGNDWWGEPVGAMLSRVLSEELAQRLPGTSVFGESGAISADPAVTIEVNVTRMDADRTGAVVLSAQVAVRRVKPARPVVARSVRLTAQPSDASVRAEVAAMSVALGQLADQVAEMLRQ